MKKLIFLSLLLILPMCFCLDNSSLNNSVNDSLVDYTNSTWYEGYLNKIQGMDVTTLLTIIIGLVIVYFLGKMAFKFIKTIIIILLVVLLIRIIF